MSTQQTRKSKNAETFETEIVIIGAGGAGLAAGLAAAEKGTNVILVEKQRTPGGNSALATGFFAVEVGWVLFLTVRGCGWEGAAWGGFFTISVFFWIVGLSAA